MATAVPKEGFEKRLAELKAQKARIEGHIEEVEFWLAQCAAFEAAEEQVDGSN